VIDTSRPSPEDFIAEGEGPPVADGSYYPLAAHALLVLVSEA
jgi:hypothetical protein